MYKIKCPYGQPGDILLVKETYYAYGWWIKNGKTKTGKQKWRFIDFTVEDNNGLYCYEDCKPSEIITKREPNVMGWYKRPSLFMPKAACRIFLKVKSVWVERLQDISEEDAIAEGIKQTWKGEAFNAYKNYINDGAGSQRPFGSFCSLWKSINGQESWEANHWVWVIEFERIELTEEQKHKFLNCK